MAEEKVYFCPDCLEQFKADNPERCPECGNDEIIERAER